MLPTGSCSHGEGSCRTNETYLDCIAHGPDSPVTVMLCCCAVRHNYLFLWLLNFSVPKVETALQHSRKEFYNIKPRVFVYVLVSSRRACVGREQCLRLQSLLK